MPIILEKEEYWGNIEYKLKFINMTPEKISKYSTQLKFRVIEGGGNAVYFIGVRDNGTIIGLKKKNITYHKHIMNKMCSEIKCSIKNLNTFNVKHNKVILIYDIIGDFDMNELPILIG
jgi:elongation factor 1-alpha